LEKHGCNGVVKCDIAEAEEQILEEHLPIEETFRFLCKKCHVEYDRGTRKVLGKPAQKVTKRTEISKENKMTTKESNKRDIRRRAKNWMSKNCPTEHPNEMHASTYDPKKEEWFFTFPCSYFEEGKTGCLYMFLQYGNDEHRFRYLKVPFSFFRENKEKFTVRKTAPKFDLHISAKERNWLVDKSGDQVSFHEYEQ